VFTTRRGLLIGAAVLAAAGCTEQAQIITADADLTAALRTARALARGAEALGYTEIAEDHRTHAATLERLLRPSVVEDEESEAPADAEALAAAESAGSAEAAESSMTTLSDYAVLLGEIAASRAAHAAVIA
jgi:HPt (histidine-containing phosphotransfer) domain-containing protein